MKTLETISTTVTEGIMETRSLSIEASGKAFKEIVSGIYSNKTYAIARELIANAFDAHTENGNPEEQFEIHIPTPFEPYFSCRDYGVSMSHEMIMDLYSVMFKSTKDDPNSATSNNFTGKFGLGSKTPFAYTDAFQLTAYLDGEIRVYDIFFDGGLPKIALFSKEPTDERNGILIDFPVDPDDFVDFTTAIVRASEPLALKPKFTGQDLDLPEREVLHAGDGWRVMDELSTRSSQIKMGTVIYPLDTSALDGITDGVRTIVNQMKLQIDIPIGDVEVTTSREALSYDERTVANILKRLDEVIVEVKAILTHTVLEADTYWLACAEYDRMRNSIGGTLYSALVGKDFVYKGRKLTGSFNMKWSDNGGYKGLSLSYVGRQELATGKHVTFRNRKPKYSLHDASINPNEKLHIVLEDMSQKKRYSNQRMEILRNDIVRNMREDGNHLRYSVLWIRYYDKLPYAYKRLMVTLGRPEVKIINLLDVEYTHINTRGYGGPTGPRDRYKVNSYGCWVSPKETDVSAEGEVAYYLLLEGKDLAHEGYIGSTKSLSLALKYLINAEIVKDGPVVGLNKSQRKRIRDNDMWIDLAELIKRKLVGSVAVEDVVHGKLSRDYSFQNKHRDVIKPLIAMFNDIDMDGTIVGEIIDGYRDFDSTTVPFITEAYDVARTLDTPIPGHASKFDTVVDQVRTAEQKLEDLQKRLDDALPLTTQFNWDLESMTKEQTKDFVNYVQFKLLKSDD